MEEVARCCKSKEKEKITIDYHRTFIRTGSSYKGDSNVGIQLEINSGTRNKVEMFYTEQLR